MATLSTRDATVVLTDYNSWTAWYRQFKMKCESLRNWPLVDPEGTEEPKPKPTVPRLPNIADYQPAATVWRGALRQALERAETRNQHNKRRFLPLLFQQGSPNSPRVDRKHIKRTAMTIRYTLNRTSSSIRNIRKKGRSTRS